MFERLAMWLARGGGAVYSTEGGEEVVVVEWAVGANGIAFARPADRPHLIPADAPLQADEDGRGWSVRWAGGVGRIVRPVGDQVAELKAAAAGARRHADLGRLAGAPLLLWIPE